MVYILFSKQIPFPGTQFAPKTQGKQIHKHNVKKDNKRKAKKDTSLLNDLPTPLGPEINTHVPSDYVFIFSKIYTKTSINEPSKHIKKNQTKKKDFKK